MKWRRTWQTSCAAAIAAASSDSGLAAGECLRRPAHDRLHARGNQLERSVEVDPAEFAVFGAADQRIDRQAHVGPPGCREVIPGDLAAAVRPGLRGVLAPG